MWQLLSGFIYFAHYVPGNIFSINTVCVFFSGVAIIVIIY